MEKKFIFRGHECCYEIWDSNKDCYGFAFMPDGHTDFIDNNGDRYFIQCYYDNMNTTPELWCERRYDEYTTNAGCGTFDDGLTDKDYAQIEAFIKSLLDE